jgi:hypothetical protein
MLDDQPMPSFGSSRPPENERRISNPPQRPWSVPVWLSSEEERPPDEVSCPFEDEHAPIDDEARPFDDDRGLPDDGLGIPFELLFPPSNNPRSPDDAILSPDDIERPHEGGGRKSSGQVGPTWRAILLAKHRAAS